MAHFLKINATKIIDVSQIQRVTKEKNSWMISVIYYGNTASVLYDKEEARIIWEYLSSISTQTVYDKDNNLIMIGE